MENALAMIAGCIAFNSGVCLFADIIWKKTDAGVNWVFILANLIALSISTTVLVVGMSVGPTFWKKIEELARKAILIATLAMAIAARQVVFAGIGEDEFWLRVLFNGLGVVFVGCPFVLSFIVPYVYSHGGMQKE